VKTSKGPGDHLIGKGGGGLWYLPWSQIDVIFMGENLASESQCFRDNSAQKYYFRKKP
jgi:hypothetical protein